MQPFYTSVDIIELMFYQKIDPGHNLIKVQQSKFNGKGKKRKKVASNFEWFNRKKNINFATTRIKIKFKLIMDNLSIHQIKFLLKRQK